MVRKRQIGEVAGEGYEAECDRENEHDVPASIAWVPPGGTGYMSGLDVVLKSQH